MPRFISLIVLLLFVCTASAVSLDSIVRDYMERQHIPGVAVAVVKDGKVAASRGFGTANLEHNVPVTPSTVFKVGSVSKQFIAAGVLLLWADGKLSLDDSLRKYFDGAPESWDKVTLRHVLSHTGGLVREGPAFNPFRIQPDAEVVRSAFVAPLAFDPGEKWQYSNVGYFAAAEIIQKLTGKPWETFVRERIFQPAGMDASRATTTVHLVPNRADGYDWVKDRYQNATDYIAVRPSGAFLSTVDDLAKWDIALDSDVPLTRRVREAMWTAVRLTDGGSSGYGLGWRVTEEKGKRLYEHGGTLPGFRAHYARYADDALSVVVLTNSSAAEPNKIAADIAALWLSDPGK
jgi:CubicO group peptidase (beta-lactamase class C family)